MIDLKILSVEENSALSVFRQAMGRGWKAALKSDWERSTYPGFDANVSSVLQRMRNSRGPLWLAKYSPDQDEKKVRDAALTEPVIAAFFAMAVELGVPAEKGEVAAKQMFGSMVKAFDKVNKEHDRDLRRCKLPVPSRLKTELAVVEWLESQTELGRRGSLALYCRPYVGLYQDLHGEAVASPVDAGKEASFAAKENSPVTAIDREVVAARFINDIPNETWLAEEVDRINAGGRNQFGVLKYFGSITGRFDRVLHLPVSKLVELPGERNEQTNVRPKALKYIRANFASVLQQPLYVEVDPLGAAWVNEGNHRIMVAAELGIVSLPVEVRYFTGGERKSILFSPQTLIELDLSVQSAIYLPVETVPVAVEQNPLASGNIAVPQFIKHLAVISKNKHNGNEQPSSVFSLPTNLVEEGRYFGMVVDVSDGFVTQKISRGGDTVNHRESNLTTTVHVHDILEIKYQGGIGVVTGKATQTVER